MSKLSLNAVDQMYQTNSDDPLLMLLTLKFPLNVNYHYVNDINDITSNGQLFTAFPFQFSLPDDTDQEVPELSITISNIGLELIDDLSSNTEGIEADINIIFASNPDFVELSVENMNLKGITYDQKFITMTLGYDDILNTQVPSYSYSAKDYPGLLSV